MDTKLTEDPPCRYDDINFRLHWYALHEDDEADLTNVGDYPYIYKTKPKLKTRSKDT